RVGRDHLALRRADQLADLVAGALRQADPVGAVPAGDEILAPFVRDDPGEPLTRAARKGSEGVAVEVDHAGRKLELLAKAAQVIGAVEGFDLRGNHGSFYGLEESCEPSATPN